MLMSALLYIILLAYSPPNDSFYLSLTNALGRNSNFIAINIKSNTYEGPVVVENGALSYYYLKVKNVNANEYKAAILDILVNDKQLNIGKTNLTKWGFEPVYFDRKVSDYASKGKEEFLRKYFNVNNVGSYVLKREEVTDKQEAAIIHQLFKWQTRISRDCETGYLVIM